MKRIMVFLLLLCLVVPALAQQPASVIAVFHIKGGQVTPVSTEIVYGGSPNYFNQHGEFIVASSTADGKYQKEAWIDDPRVGRLLDFEETEPSAVMMDDIDFTVIMPFEADTAKVSVYDSSKNLMAESDLGGARNAFCMVHPGDERCRGTAAIGGIVLILVVGIAGAGAYIVLKRKKAGG